MPAAGERVLVTGSDGFIGSAVTRALLGDGYRVVALVEPGQPAPALDDLDVERVDGDLRDAAVVRHATAGCVAVFHVAALYRFWASNPEDFYEINVGGTRNVLEAARQAQVAKVVYTSTVGTLGLHESGPPADESSYPELHHLFGSYKRSKYVAEHEVLRAGAEGLPVSLVLPTFPLGPGDTAPTPTGQLILDFLNGRVPGYVNTVLNVAHVDDVARGHLLALEKGGQGRSYILGGENLGLQQLLRMLAGLTGLPEARIKVPRAVSLAAAWASESIEGHVLRRHPSIPLEAARMSTTQMAFNDSRAREELGYTSRPAALALEASARWFVDQGFVIDRRRTKIRWNPPDS
jgi:dihydroflavonol-4-reductase